MRWLSALSISLILIVVAIGSYYVYYVEDRMSQQHDEKLRSLGTVARLFEAKLDSLSTVVRNTPYLAYRDLDPPGEGVFESCKKINSCNRKYEEWHKAHKWGKQYYRKDRLDV